MRNQLEILNNILNQREALFHVHKKYGTTKTELEVLAYSTLKSFFTLYDLQKAYPHTNIQQLRRSLKKLHKDGVLNIIYKGVKGKPTYYGLQSIAKDILKTYSSIILKNRQSAYL